MLPSYIPRPDANLYTRKVCNSLRDLVPFVQFKKREKRNCEIGA